MSQSSSSISLDKKLCINCSKETSVGSNNRFCEDCKDWDHYYEVTVHSILKNGDHSCFYCNQLRDQTPLRVIMPLNSYLIYYVTMIIQQQEISYISEHNTEPPVKHENEDPEESMTGDDNPVGRPHEWQFYWNIKHEKGFNIKLADCLETILDDGSVVYIRAQFLFRDTSQKAWISGFKMIESSQVKNLQRKIRKRKNGKRVRETKPENLLRGDWVILDHSELLVDLSCVQRILCGLSLTEIEFGKPRGASSSDVFSIGCRYNMNSGELLPLMVTGYKICKSYLVWHNFTPENEDIPLPLLISTSAAGSSRSSILSTPGSERKKIVTSESRRVSFNPETLYEVKPRCVAS